MLPKICLNFYCLLRKLTNIVLIRSTFAYFATQGMNTTPHSSFRTPLVFDSFHSTLVIFPTVGSIAVIKCAIQCLASATSCSKLNFDNQVSNSLNLNLSNNRSCAHYCNFKRKFAFKISMQSGDFQSWQ